MKPPFETSPALTGLAGIRHGFFGRLGGSSTGEFASLNVSETGGDDRAIVAGNRAAILETLGFDRLATLTQTHSNRVVTLTGLPGDGERPDADALVTNQPGLLLGILTADCTPIAFADGEAGVVGIAHAGWKGAVHGIAENAIAAMEALGARRERIVAVIGPTISGANYEVGPQFAADLVAINPDTAAHIATPPGGKEHFDLPGFVRARLEAAGVAVEQAGSCTYASPERYFSHRYATHQGTKTGRQLSVIGLF
ncbi:peptidoglycan editing factor PgeF [Devosia sp. D6-9]|nr:peptidoglycan editing factor PgeF [Devosia sp. D6-9]